MLIGEMSMWRSLVVGSTIRNTRKLLTCTARRTLCRLSRSPWERPVNSQDSR
jgi:hypothetical protein